MESHKMTDENLIYKAIMSLVMEIQMITKELIAIKKILAKIEDYKE